MENNSASQSGDPENRRTIIGLHMGTSNIVGGLVLVGIGVLFLLGNLHIVRDAAWIAYWPVILVVVGLVQLVDSSSTNGRIGGGILFLVGGIFLADNLGYLSFPIWDLWPVVLIAIGILMLWDRAGIFTSRRTAERFTKGWNIQGLSSGSTTASGIVNEFAIFGGSKRTIATQDFRGGKVAVLFGGVTLDLRAAGMLEEAAVLNVSALYGGISIKIPPTWSVEVHGAGIFGGFGDHTIHPPAVPGMKRLIIKGAVLFGGVAIKN
jgi:predicted membrane protein